MVLNPHLTLKEFVFILRSGLAAITNEQIGTITIVNYDKNLIFIDLDDKVEAQEFCHRAD